MLKMTIDNEEVVSNKDISIKEEILSPSSTILNNVYPKEWENDKDYTSRFYYPKDYSKLNIQNFSVEPEEAGTTVEINENATINDVDTTKESKVVSLKGQTSQVSYSGANLLPQDKYITTRTTNGITYTNNGDGTFSLTGTATANTTIQIIAPGEFNLESGQSYYLYTSKAYDGTTFNVSVRFNENGTRKYLTPKYTITPSGTITNTDFAFYIASGNTVSATNVKAMLVKGTSAPTTYEPYVGGTASPNPNFPEPVNVVSGDNYINICGKNLLNLNGFVKGRLNQNTGEIQYASNVSSLVVSGDNITFTATVAWNNGITSDFIPIEQGKYFYRGTATGDKLYVYVDYFDKDKNWLSRLGSANSAAGVEKIWELNFNEPNARFIRLHYEKATTGTITISNSMLEKSNVATTYEPYIGRSYPIYLGVENLFNGTLYNTQVGSNGGITSNTQRVANVNVNGTSDFYLQKGTYTLSIPNLEQCTCLTKNSGGTIIDNFANAWQTLPFTFTLTQPGYLYFTGRKANSSVLTPSDYTPQVEKGSKVNHASTTPIELCKIGTYQDKIYKGVGSNLFKGYANMETGFLPQSGAYPTTNSSYPNARYQLIEIKAGESITTSNSTNSQGRLRYIDKDTNQVIGTICATTDYFISTGDYGSSFNNGTITAKKDFIIGVLLLQDITQETQFMINKGSSALPYEPYGAKDKWLLHKEIGKVVLNGSETYSSFSNNRYRTLISISGADGFSNLITICNLLKGTTQSRLASTTEENLIAVNGNYVWLRITSTTTSQELASLLSNTNAIVYYALANSTNTEITDNTLTSQLDNLSS